MSTEYVQSCQDDESEAWNTEARICVGGNVSDRVDRKVLERFWNVEHSSEPRINQKCV